MPKIYTVQIEVPSGSRPDKFFQWITELLAPHRMKPVSLNDETGNYSIARSLSPEDKP